MTAAGLAAAMLVPLLLLGCAGGRGCEAVLANASGQPVEQVYLTRAGDPDRGGNLLAARDLAPGATLPLRFPGRGPHALRIVWADGRAIEAPAVAACRIARVTLQEGGLRQEQRRPPPGGGMDMLARAFLPFVQHRLPGTVFVVINRPTAGGQQAFEGVAQAAPDGFTVGAAQAPNSITLPIERQVRYRVQDFTFLGSVVEDPCGLWVRADSPLRGAADLVAAARRSPERIAVGTAGVGSDDHLLVLALQEATGAAFQHVPFNGTPPIVTGLLSRSIDAGSFNMSEGAGLLRDGTVRALAQGGTGRWGGAAAVPTLREQGFDVVLGSTRGLVAPSGLPADIVGALRAAVDAANADPAWTAEAERLNLPLRPMSAEAQRRLFLDEDARLRALWARRPWRE